MTLSTPGWLTAQYESARAEALQRRVQLLEHQLAYYVARFDNLKSLQNMAADVSSALPPGGVRRGIDISGQVPR